MFVQFINVQKYVCMLFILVYIHRSVYDINVLAVAFIRLVTGLLRVYTDII